MAVIDTVIFDKTGTLTTGALQLSEAAPYSRQALALAAGLARESRHPLSRALAKAAGPVAEVVRHVREEPGCGLEGETPAGTVRLGSRAWVGAESPSTETDAKAELWLRDAHGTITRFAFDDELRPDAAETIEALKQQGIAVALLSGDREAAVRDIAETLGIADWHAGCRPQDKVARLATLAEQGHRVLMVGDGLNDAPALATAHVSMSPAGAADVTQVAADFISLGDRLGAVGEALATAHASRRLVLQNFAFALAYNVVAIPLAMAGLVTPLIAAAAMSGSSITVTLNALRLKWIS
jgi:Cu2+-exporting ATPase